MQIKEINNQQFRDFANNFEQYSIYQTPEYAFIMNHQNYTTLLVGLFDKEVLVGASVILIEKIYNFNYAYAPRGFLVDYSNFNLLSEFTKQIKRYLGRKNVIAVKISPIITRNIHSHDKYNIIRNENYDKIFNNLKNNGYFHMGYNNYFEAMKPRFEAIIDINKPYYEIFGNFKKEVRTKIRCAAKKGVMIYRGNQNQLDYLYLQIKNSYKRDFNYFQDCYSYFSKHNAIEFYYAKINTEEYLKETKKQYDIWERKIGKINKEIQENPNKSEKLLSYKMKLDLEFSLFKKQLINATNLLAEYPDGIVAATVLVVTMRDTVKLLYDSYDSRFKSFNAKHLLIWKIIEKYSQLGYKKFNMGGMTSIEVEDNPYQGLNTFKLGFTPQVYEYIGDLELITNHPLYFMYRNAAPIRNALKK